MAALLLGALVYAQMLSDRARDAEQDGAVTPAATQPADDAAVVRRFSDDFSVNATVEEAGDISESADSDWWLGSGAFFYRAEGTGRTVRGSLEAGSKWQTLYRKNDPGETDDGEHPQNIFRLVLRKEWRNLIQQSYFKIIEYRQSSDEHRSASNGLLLFNRYRDEDNLYYTGIRVDGTAVIKKKVDGAYYTMASKRIYAGEYDRESNPNLLPTDTWIGIRSEVSDNDDGTVAIRLFIDRDRSGKWEFALEAEDDGKSFGGEAIRGEGYAGIRTDFMDAQFDDYTIAERE